MLLGAIVVLVVLVAVLAVPIAVRFDVSWHGELEQRVDLIWAFGLVRKRLPFVDTRSPNVPRAARKSHEQTRDRSRRRRAHVLAALRLKSFRRRLLRFLASLWHAIRKDHVNVAVRLGLGDPADTGRLWGLIGPCAGLLQRVPEMAVSVEPDFQDAVFDLDSSGALRVVPLNVLLIIVGLAVSPTFWRGIRVLRRGG
jgi:hypothetical protein